MTDHEEMAEHSESITQSAALTRDSTTYEKSASTSKGFRDQSIAVALGDDGCCHAIEERTRMHSAGGSAHKIESPDLDTIGETTRTQVGHERTDSGGIVHWITTGAFNHSTSNQEPRGTTTRAYGECKARSYQEPTFDQHTFSSSAPVEQTMGFAHKHPPRPKVLRYAPSFEASTQSSRAKQDTRRKLPISRASSTAQVYNHSPPSSIRDNSSPVLRPKHTPSGTSPRELGYGHRRYNSNHGTGESSWADGNPVAESNVDVDITLDDGEEGFRISQEQEHDLEEQHISTLGPLKDELRTSQSTLMNLQVENAQQKNRLEDQNRLLFEVKSDLEVMVTANQRLNEHQKACEELRKVFEALTIVTEDALHGSWEDIPDLTQLNEQLRLSTNVVETDVFQNHSQEALKFQIRFQQLIERVNRCFFAFSEVTTAYETRLEEQERELSRQQEAFDAEYRVETSRRIVENMIREKRKLQAELNVQYSSETKLRKEARDLRIDLEGAQDQNKVLLEELKRFHTLQKAWKVENNELKWQKDKLFEEVDKELASIQEQAKSYHVKKKELEEYQQRCSDSHYLRFDSLQTNLDKLRRDFDEQSRDLEVVINKNAELENRSGQLTEHNTLLEDQLAGLNAAIAQQQGTTLYGLPLVHDEDGSDTPSLPFLSKFPLRGTEAISTIDYRSPEFFKKRDEEVTKVRRRQEEQRKQELNRMEMMERARKWQYDQFESSDKSWANQLRLMNLKANAEAWGCWESERYISSVGGER